MDEGQQKTILVTGGAGFIGTHLCTRLAHEGHRVISLDNYFSGSKDNHVLGVEYREGHTKDVARLVPEYVDLIYHLGEYARVEVSLEEPGVVWNLNLQGTLAVVEFWRARKVKLIYAGSSTKFADKGDGKNQSPYAFAKAINTELVQNYGRWYGLPFAVTYFYNVYGPGERAGRYGTLIQIFVGKFLNGKPLTVVAPGTQRRNFTHVSDIVNGLVLVGEEGEGDGFEIGSDESFSILEVAELFSAPIEMVPSRAGNRNASLLNPAKMKALGWRAEKSLSVEIQKVVARNSLSKSPN